MVIRCSKWKSNLHWIKHWMLMNGVISMEHADKQLFKSKFMNK